MTTIITIALVALAMLAPLAFVTLSAWQTHINPEHLHPEA